MLRILFADARAAARLATLPLAGTPVADPGDADLVVAGIAGPWCYRILPLWGRVPVLLARATAPYTRPLLAVDPRHDSAAMFSLVRDLLPREPPRMTSLHIGALDPRVAARHVATTLPTLGPFGVGWMRRFASGDVSAIIAQAAREMHANLVVLAGRRRPAISRMLLGSTTRAVIRALDCDVLVVPREATAIPTVRTVQPGAAWIRTTTRRST